MLHLINNFNSNNFNSNNFYNFLKKKKLAININFHELYANNFNIERYHLMLQKRTFITLTPLLEIAISNIIIFQFATLKGFEFFFFELKQYFNTVGTTTYLNPNSYKYSTQKQMFLNNFKSYPFTYFSYVSSPDDILINKLLLNNTNNIQLNTYLKNEEKLLQLIDNKIWKQVTTKKSFFYTNYDLYEFNNLVPFINNLKLNEILYVNLNWLSFLSFNDNLATYDLTSSFYYEPFFFFREKIQQSMLEFRMISHFRARSLLFDD